MSHPSYFNVCAQSDLRWPRARLPHSCSLATSVTEMAEMVNSGVAGDGGDGCGKCGGDGWDGRDRCDRRWRRWPRWSWRMWPEMEGMEEVATFTSGCGWRWRRWARGGGGREGRLEGGVVLRDLRSNNRRGIKEGAPTSCAKTTLYLLLSLLALYN